MKVTLIAGSLFLLMGVVLLIVTPLTSNSMVSVTTLVNETTYEIKDVVIPNRNIESVNTLSKDQFSEQNQAPGAFESSFYTQVNLTINQEDNMGPRIKQSVHSQKPKRATSVNSVFDQVSYNLTTVKTLQDLVYNQDNSTVTYR